MLNTPLLPMMRGVHFVMSIVGASKSSEKSGGVELVPPAPPLTAVPPVPAEEPALPAALPPLPLTPAVLAPLPPIVLPPTFALPPGAPAEPALLVVPPDDEPAPLVRPPFAFEAPELPALQPTETATPNPAKASVNVRSMSTPFKSRSTNVTNNLEPIPV
jgi:hypothetical protein